MKLLEELLGLSEELLKAIGGVARSYLEELLEVMRGVARGT